LSEEEGRLEANGSEDERNFAGLYGQIDWQPLAKVDVLFGLRLNSTKEKAEGEVKADPDEPTDPDAPEEGGRVERDETRLSGSAGVTWSVWSQGTRDRALRRLSQYLQAGSGRLRPRARG
jgi:outer membrane receptor protein involved in Fe transport